MRHSRWGAILLLISCQNGINAWMSTLCNPSRSISSRTTAHVSKPIQPYSLLNQRRSESRHSCINMKSDDLVLHDKASEIMLYRRAQIHKAALLGSLSIIAIAITSLHPTRVLAAVSAAVSEEKLHVGQKIATYFRSTGRLPDWATIMLISAMPVVELRGGVPVGLWMDLPIAKVFGLCVLGNMIPIPLILLALRSNFIQKIAKPLLDRARHKAAGFGDVDKQAAALLLFVGIPLPGTGAWTGAMIASVLGMPVNQSMVAIFGGVISAGVIMTALTLAGKIGAISATAVLAIFCLANMKATKK